MFSLLSDEYTKEWHQKNCTTSFIY
jgi:hypothetical protein